MNVLEIDGLTVDFATEEGRLRAVDGASFRIGVNRTTALVGESGSGKSVISQAVMGILPRNAEISGGSILFRDPLNPDAPVDIAGLDPLSTAMREIRGNRIAIIFQEPMTSLSPIHTIGDQIGEVVVLHRRLSRAEARRLTRDMLRLVHFPDPDRGLDTYPFELSGGLRQRAMIAMALVCRPALLIADEPTTALDVTIQAQILKLIREVQAELQMSVLMITHDFGVVANVADEVAVIYNGRIMESGPAEELFRDPRHDYLKALLHAVPRFHMARSQRLVPLRPIAADTNGFLKHTGERPSVERGAPLLDVQAVSKSFTLRKSGFVFGHAHRIKALDGVTFAIRRGECLGLVGESGSGKSTTARAILRAIAVDSGRICFNMGGAMTDITTLHGDELMAYRRAVQMIFQDPFSSLNPRMTVFEILSEPFVIHRIGTREERAESIRELMRLVGLDPRFLKRYPHSFSGGQRQRIGIARALALRPQLVLCDEPVSALDVSVQAQILNLLKDLKEALGLTYLFVSHNLAVIDYIADRIAVMCRGRLVELATTRDLINRPIHPYTRALLAAVPEPDIDDRLDFAALDEAGASDPGAWPAPFTVTPSTDPVLCEMEPEHFVAAPGLAAAQLAEVS